MQMITSAMTERLRCHGACRRPLDRRLLWSSMDSTYNEQCPTHTQARPYLQSNYIISSLQSRLDAIDEDLLQLFRIQTSDARLNAGSNLSLDRHLVFHCRFVRIPDIGAHVYNPTTLQPWTRPMRTDLVHTPSASAPHASVMPA